MYNLVSPDYSKLFLNFSEFNLEYDDFCVKDNFTITYTNSETEALNEIVLCGSQLPPDLLLESNSAKLTFQSSENVATPTKTRFVVESGTVFPGYEEFTNVETRHLPKNSDGVVFNDDIPYKDSTLKTVVLNSSVEISAELVFMDIEYQSICEFDFLQIYVDQEVVIDRTCGYTIGRMLGVSDQETGRFGWAKRQ